MRASVSGLIAVGSLCLGVATAHAQNFRTYDASLGTLPEAQGWTRIGSGSPAPTVSGGILSQSRGYGVDAQAWMRTDLPNDFSPSADPFYLEASLKVSVSDYNEYAVGGGRWETGYLIYATDAASRSFVFGISDTGIRLSTDQPGLTNSLSSPFISMDTTSGFNTYRLEVAGGTGSLFVNGALATSLALGAPYVGQAQPNRVLFGSFPNEASTTEMKYLTYGTQQAVPEPGVLALGAGGVSLGILISRRRKPV